VNLEELLVVYKKAKSFRGARAHNLEGRAANVSCGDEVSIFFDVQDGILKDISFEAKGCAMSTASCYLLAEKFRGKKLSDLLSLSDDEYLNVIGMPDVGLSRKKCVLTALEAARRHA
jgi:nitrogen fixation NifU-like protein